ncbi:PAS domain S-box protein [Pseudanabaena sp. FACHB-1998]|uniref:ATP-binding protein n=1 Tax=Pseudanabaena sp. FACHB-1998 TaxID=2692858 RepID=UPI0016811653|nr:ATP-binding protein [Pseudanabaena sp. FACHB-1998]MBD2177595.1 PAS domain S-box protein [Pseudanabaena sp. FACHB-1998]
MITTVLIVDKSEIMRQQYHHYLIQERPHDYLILEADSLSKARDICKLKKPDVILSGLPSIDKRWEFLECLHHQQHLLPILLIVDQADEKSAAKANNGGIQDYLVKEYLNADRLLRSMDNLLEKMRLVNIFADALKLRKRSEEVIIESVERSRRLIECSDDLIWSSDLNGKFIYLSPQFTDLFGWEPSEWISKSMTDIIHAGDRLRFKENFNQLIVNNDIHRESLPIEFRHQQRDGSYVWVSSNITLIRNSQGEAIAVQGILKDISDRIALAYAIRDRKQVESKLRESNEILSVVNHELMKATQLKNEFLANISHELRTPLNIVLGLIESLQEGIYGSLSDKQRKVIRTIENSSNHLLGLINNILDFSQMEVGYLELNQTKTSISDLCKDSAEFLKFQAANKSIQLSIEIMENLPDLFIDERRIRQVIIHLLDNALKFTPKLGKVILAASCDNSWIKISITDTGIGIAPENLNKLFQPFIQLDSNLNRRYDGTGLGLAIVKQIVDAHGGRVEVQSKIALGSCFKVLLPINNTKTKNAVG